MHFGTNPPPICIARLLLKTPIKKFHCGLRVSLITQSFSDRKVELEVETKEDGNFNKCSYESEVSVNSKIPKYYEIAWPSLKQIKKEFI